MLSRAEVVRAVEAPFHNWPAECVRVPYSPDLYPEGGARLFGPLRTWRCLRGPDPLAGFAGSPPEYHCNWAWLDLLFIWKNILRLCSHPEAIHAAYFSTKATLELARLWVWIEEGNICTTHDEAVRRDKRSSCEVNSTPCHGRCLMNTPAGVSNDMSFCEPHLAGRQGIRWHQRRVYLHVPARPGGSGRGAGASPTGFPANANAVAVG